MTTEILITIGIILVGGFFMYYFPTKMVYGLTPLQQYKMFKKVENNIKKLVRKNWEMVEMSRWSVKKGMFNDYSLYVEIKNKKIRHWRILKHLCFKENVGKKIWIPPHIKGEGLKAPQLFKITS